VFGEEKFSRLEGMLQETLDRTHFRCVERERASLERKLIELPPDHGEGGVFVWHHKTEVEVTVKLSELAGGEHEAQQTVQGVSVLGEHFDRAHVGLHLAFGHFYYGGFRRSLLGLLDVPLVRQRRL